MKKIIYLAVLAAPIAVQNLSASKSDEEFARTLQDEEFARTLQMNLDREYIGLADGGSPAGPAPAPAAAPAKGKAPASPANAAALERIRIASARNAAAAGAAPATAPAKGKAPASPANAAALERIRIASARNAAAGAAPAPAPAPAKGKAPASPANAAALERIRIASARNAAAGAAPATAPAPAGAAAAEKGKAPAANEIQVLIDHELAKRLAAEENECGVRSYTEEELRRYDEDYRLALKLQFNDDVAPVGEESLVRLTPVLAEELKEIVKEAEKYNDSKVHTFNEQFAKKYSGILQDIARTLPFVQGEDVSLDELSKVFLEKADAGSDALNRNLNQLKKYGKDYKDDESGVSSVLSLYNLNYKLARYLEESGRYDGAFQLIIGSLCENFGTGGGCRQGFAGRSVRDLMTLLLKLA